MVQVDTCVGARGSLGGGPEPGQERGTGRGLLSLPSLAAGDHPPASSRLIALIEAFEAARAAGQPVDELIGQIGEELFHGGPGGVPALEGARS